MRGCFVCALVLVLRLVLVLVASLAFLAVIGCLWLGWVADWKCFGDLFGGKVELARRRG